MQNLPKKSLGQHWLNDQDVLKKICEEAEINNSDTVLEIGPGQGALTRYLVKQAKQVIAVELDGNLSKQLPKSIQADNLKVINEDILKFNLNNISNPYKIVANIPYYLTNHLVRIISEAKNPPVKAILLVQKEVAQRICAQAGNMSVLGVTAQFYFDTTLSIVVKAEKFTPPPKVDSQVVILNRKQILPLDNNQTKDFFRLVKAGFSERRKKLRSSLSGGLGITKFEAEELLNSAGISPSSRAQELTLEQWLNLRRYYN